MKDKNELIKIYDLLINIKASIFESRHYLENLNIGKAKDKLSRLQHDLENFHVMIADLLREENELA